MVKQINQHILSYNLNYRNEIAVKFMASIAVVTRFPLLVWYSWEKERKKKKKNSVLLKAMGDLVEQ